MEKDIFQVAFLVKTKNQIENFFQESDKHVIPIDVESENSNLKREIFIQKNGRNAEEGRKNSLYLFVIYHGSNEQDNKSQEYINDAWVCAKDFISIFDMVTDVEPLIEIDFGSTKYLERHQQGSIYISKVFKIGAGQPKLNSFEKFVFENTIMTLLGNASLIFKILKWFKKKPDFLYLAIKYYHSSKLYRTHFTDRQNKDIILEKEFLDLFFCLECLLNESPGDISYKISIRSCLLYCLDPYDPANDLTPKEIFDLIKKSYSIRNSIVHGKVDGKRDVKLENQTNKLREATFKIFISVLRLAVSFRKSNRLKEDILDEVDFCLIDIKRKQEVNERIQNMDFYALTQDE